MGKICMYKMAELFCGPGGLALGAKKAGVTKDGVNYIIEPVWATDIDQYACETYKNNIHKNNPEKVICRPIERINLHNIPEFDGLSFGFPCNDFSRVGEQKGINGKYGPLYTYAVKALNIHNPKWFLAENVKGLKNTNDGNTLKKILSELEKAGKGYELTTHLYKFEEYGVPQNRHRIIIIGIRKDMNLKFKVPKPTTPNKYKTAQEAIEKPPIKLGCNHHNFMNQTGQIVERLKYIKPGENVWSEKVPPHLRINTKTQLSNIYKRLALNEPSYTVTGSGGGGTYMYHWKEHRALTNRERARLQTFPDNFLFIGSFGNVRKQIGMAVPPKASKIIFNALLKTLAGINYNSVKENGAF
jgi:DNA (cytosine-5)-methyltransferase 1